MKAKKKTIAIEFGYNLTDSWNGPAVRECVAGKTFTTRARWRVVNDATIRVGPASARARVHAFAVDAGLSRRAI